MNAVNSQKSSLLPKYVLVVLDDDLISYLDFKREGLATLLGTWVEWLVKELSEIVKTRLSQLPLKSRKVVPFFYWVTAPNHTYFSKERNALCTKFILSLESVIRAQDNMRVIRLKDGWNSKDSLLVINDRMTENGLSAYWRSVDASFKFNSLKREFFIAKQTVQMSHNESQCNQVSAQHARTDNEDDVIYVSRQQHSRLYEPIDPMWSFFRRHSSHAECHMDVCEDQPIRQDARFFLPQLKSHRRF